MNDLKIRSLSDRINDTKELMYLYPDIEKSIIFEKSEVYVGEDQNGYISPTLQMNLMSK